MKTRIVRTGRIIKEYTLIRGAWKLTRVYC
jgi:hypothetical protein